MTSAVAFALSCSGLRGQDGAATSARMEASGIRRIDIESSIWNGKKVITRKLVIRATKNGYVDGKRKLDVDVVRELMAAIDSPPQALEALTPAVFGADQDWLHQNGFDAAGFLKTVNGYYKDTLILDADGEFILKLVRKDGSRIRVQSAQPHNYMIPWKITTRCCEFETYNISVSKAIVRLLPEDFLNYSRIAGAYYGLEFRDEMARSTRRSDQKSTTPHHSPE